MWFTQKELIKTLRGEIAKAQEERTQALRIIDLIERKDFGGSLSGLSLGNSVLVEKLRELRSSLGKYEEQEAQRIWVADGLAKIGFLFEDGSKSFEAMVDKLLADLIKYMNANQGALYIVEEEDNVEYLKMSGVYAYGKKRYVDCRIDLYEGLVGQAFLEGSYIYMTDVPRDYVKITSGLGEATPTCLFIIPLQTRTKKIGVLELAFFKKLETWQIQFLEKLSENLANAIYLIQSSSHNSTLLKHSQEVTAQLQAKESELLQHLNDLEEIQSNLNAKNAELERARLEIIAKKDELEYAKQVEYELIDSKLKTQKAIHNLTVAKLNKKIQEQEALLNSRMLINHFN